MSGYLISRESEFEYFGKKISKLSCPLNFTDMQRNAFQSEITFNKLYREFDRDELEIMQMHKQAKCFECKYSELLFTHEANTIRSILDGANLEITSEIGDLKIVKVKRISSEELYYEHEYDESGRQSSGTYYGAGSHLSEQERLVFLNLEIKNFCESALNDDDANANSILEKRRYIEAAIEMCTSFENLFSNPKMQPAAESRDSIIQNAAFSLGYVLAEYKWRFPTENMRIKGVTKAKEANEKFGKIRRRICTKIANEIMSVKPEMLADLTRLSAQIEKMNLPELRLKNGQNIGQAAIRSHLKAALKSGKLKNS